jgi:16S rRNA (cytosine967-C5)-methyltransferase
VSRTNASSPADRRVAQATRRAFAPAAGGASQAPQTASLASHLQQVAHVLVAIQAGKSWAELQAGIDDGQRAAVQALCFAVLRQWGMAQALRGRLAAKKPTPYVDAMLCAALALICAQDAEQPPAGAAFADHVIVSQAVEAIKAQPRLAVQASFVNACLRRFLRERVALTQALQAEPQARFNHPAWWVRRLRADWPHDWQSILQANLQPAPLCLRVNRLKCDAALMESALIAANFIADGETQRVAESGLQVRRNLPISRLPGYSQGWFSVQDAAAQLAAPLLLDALSPRADGAPLRILDACAAPGGKTSHLLERAPSRQLGVEVLALDIDAQRCERIAENLSRLGLSARVLAADAAQPALWHEASGIVRRHPDIPWLRRETDVSTLAAQQKRLLNALWPILEPGGVLLYCTCSVFKAEGQEQIEAFVAHNTDALSLPAPGHLLPGNTRILSPMLENSTGDHDGFFYALLRKRG